MRRYVSVLAAGCVVALAAAPAGALSLEDEDAPVHTAGKAMEGGWNLHSNGEVGAYVKTTQEAVYTVIVRAAGTPCRGTWPQIAVAVDRRHVGRPVVVKGREFADYAFEVAIPPGPHVLTVAFLNDAVAGGEDRNVLLDKMEIRAPAGVKGPAAASPAEIAADADRREEAALVRAARGAEKHRQSGATVRVLRDNKPVPDAAVTVEQTARAFLFGCNIYAFDRFKTDAENAAYKRRFADLFNYATLGFYWRSYEPERGKPQYEYTDTVVAWCRAHGIRMKGHPLLWDHRAGVPQWSDGQPPPEVQKARVQAIVRRYAGTITFWEVVNEATHCRGVPIDGPYRWAREAAPSAHLIVNDYSVFDDGQPEFFRFLEAKIAAGVPFQGIGIQAHEPRTMWFPIDRVQVILDHYATLGKAIHLTEFTPQSAGKPMTGGRQGTWDEAAQAEYAERFYRIAFGHPAVVAITWWDLADGHSWLPGGGLLRKDLSPKPAYERLRRLIHEEWTTRAAGPTDRTGAFRFRGYHGTYRVTVEAAGKKTTAEGVLQKDGPNAWMVRLE
ncbi:MAG: endo-1,4-beta-xylanase [Planctomycetota bacterium]|nr:endo-1,4-beta-xylanase [Planctomycetota bacterium]